MAQPANLPGAFVARGSASGLGGPALAPLRKALAIYASNTVAGGMLAQAR